MAHGSAVHIQAQGMYVAGASYDEIAAELDRDGTHVNPKTLQDWAEKENWKAAKEKAIALAQQKNTERAADRWARVLAQTERLRDDVVTVMENVPPPKTMEGGVAALVQLTRLLRELSPKNTLEGDAGEIIKIVMDAVFEHPKAKIVLEKYKDAILENVSAKLRRRNVGSTKSGGADASGV